MAVKLNIADLEFILRQIKISEAHAAGTPLTEIFVDAQGNVVPAGTPDALPAISDPLVPFGLRTVDGTYNNLVEGRETWGAADQTMPRMLTENFINDADGDMMPFGGPGAPVVTNNDYGVIGTPSPTNGGHTGNVADADPRIISNLVNDQSIANPAAVEAWFANDAAIAAFHARYGEDAIPVRPGEGSSVVPVANASFEDQSLASGEPGVLTDARGNYTTTAPTGWSITGTGGLFAPVDTISATAGHPGPNVTWLTNGATLTQDSTTLTAGRSYQLGLSVGDRTDQVWSGGTASLIAVGPGGVQTVLSTVTLPEPADGQWADVTLETGAVPGQFAGQTLRIAIQQTGGSQILIDDVTLTEINPGVIEIDNIDMATIPNIAPDDGISAPFNAWMTFFGQFFDHGLDLITKGDNGTVFIPLQADDPLVLGADGLAGTADDLPAGLRFMAMTRSTPLTGPGADGIMGTADDTTHEGRNTTTPFVDQNQTYTSHASHQVFLREYTFDAAGRPVATGKLLDGANGGLPTWGEIKANAATFLGIQLTDGDVLNIPLLRTDQYGEFVRGENGLPQIVTGLGADGIPNTADDEVVEGNLAAPVNTFTAGAVRISHSFLDDIAHSANPAGKIADDDSTIGLSDSVSTDGTYDNELLDRHFITGDGRGNENIGLTAVHHVFHSEHNRQVEQNKATLLDSGDIDLINEYLLTDITEIPADLTTLNWDGERLFQTARFATEMQYQHLVFEEFGRKIHPNIDPFVFNAVTDINPAIFAEFANVVYRFGHSMLTDGMPRVMVDEAGGVTTDNMGLITAFLNPVAFDNDGAMTANEASAAVILGMTTERGSQIDEFVVSSLRSNLLGLPLDLAAINIARGRDTGMPTFNDARAELYQQTNSPWLKPYDNWVELAANLKTPMTVVNLIAAYGTHQTILDATTLAEKRDAAFDLVFGGPAVSDAERFDFLLGRNGWTAETNGLNSIDLWVGGLAERIMPFGGMLGSTFTAVFEAQMEALQDGDRFYYLSRTQGQNFLNELEQNSFSKMLLANTSLSDPGADGIRGTADDIVTHHIGVDAFGLYDFVLEVNRANQLIDDPTGNDPILEALGLGKVVRDDPTTTEVETNYIRFTGGEHVVVGGTNAADTIITSDGDDGIWGDDGDDYIESGFGVDLVNGGGGNDIILDSGDEGDFLKGEDGDDVIASANGADILMGGDGKDFIVLGVDAAEIFGGEGDDFILGGDGADFLLGNEGDDWMEAGGGFDTTAGDNSELFFNSLIVGHDVMFAGSDEHDFDAESGDDIMVQGASVMRNEGMFGFDWSIFKGLEQDAYADLRIKIFTTEQADILRNRYDKVEALSGWEFDDTLLGDDRTAGDLAPGAALTGANEGIFFNDGLDQAGIDRIDGLSALVTIADGATFWEDGNILLGGGGSDLIAGNGGNDIIDGDRWLNVRIRITGDPNDENTAGNEIATVDSLRHVFTAEDAADPSWIGKSLFELMVSRAIVPGQMNIVREILTGGNDGDVDVAIFNDDRDQYEITYSEDGTITVAHTGFGTNADVLTDDGTDTLHNIEVLRFRDGDVLPPQPATGQPVINDPTPTDGQVSPVEGQLLTVDTSAITDANGLGTFSFQWQFLDGATWTDIPGATGATFTPNDPNFLQQLFGDISEIGRQLRVEVSFTDGSGTLETVYSEPTLPVAENTGVTLNGTTFANNTLNGGPGNDTLNGVSPFFGVIGGNDTLNGNDGDDVLNGNGGNDVLNGGAGTDVLDGAGGNDILNGGAGDDLISAGSGTDTIIQSSTDGRDLVDGGTGSDTYRLLGNAEAETFTIYAMSGGQNAGLAASLSTVIQATTEIVITRTVGAVTTVVAELDNIEEIAIDTLAVSANDGNGVPNGGDVGGDTVAVVGNFNATSLNFSTITIDGTAADDTVDISALTSAHRIVFRGAGGNDTIVGTLRPQDVVELPGTGEATVSQDANGMVTLSRGGASVTFDGSHGMPGVGDGNGDDAANGDFTLTESDLAGLASLVRGRPATEGDDDTEGAAGVRTLSGAGNNLDDADFGAADVPFIRLTEAHYGAPDENGNLSINPIFAGLDPRDISNILGTQDEATAPNAMNANNLFMAFGQYFDHGLDFVGKDPAFGTIAIGGPGMERGPMSDNPADLTRAAVAGYDENGVPLHLNKASPFVDQNQAYGSHELVGQFLRESDGAQGFGTRLLGGEADPSDPDFTLLPTLRDAIEHHWEANTIFRDPGLDGGQVAFRDAYPGLIDETTGEIDAAIVQTLNADFLGSGYPLLLDTNPFINLLDHRVAGDGRANENFALTSIHTIWARNHNFHAENLVAQGFDGTPEEIFQAAKMLNESDYQRVVFQEFADKLLGGLRSPDGGTGNHGWDGYNPDADARISHEFAGAAYRFGHSLISETMTVMGPDGTPIQVPLFDAFLNPTNDPSVFTAPLPPGYVPAPGYAQHGVAAIIAGTATQVAEEVDYQIVDAVRNDLVRINADLFAFNVARSWDLGLGTLNQVRADLAASSDRYVSEAVGLAGDMSPYADWDDFQDRNGLSEDEIALFKAAYPDLVLSTPEEIAAFVAANPGITLIDGGDGTKIVAGIDRVDLWVGGLAEQHINGGMVGQTFWVVIHEQLDRLQEGDRFYYLDRFENFDFYQDVGEDTTFANIVARNTSLTDLDTSIFDATNDNADEDDVAAGDDTTAPDDGNADDDGAADDGNADDDGAADDDTTTDGADDGDAEDSGDADDDAVTPPPLAAAAGIIGTAGGDNLFGTDAGDRILSLDGQDMVFAGAGDDVVLAGSGRDMVFGDAGDDRIFGEGGHDFIEGGAGSDFMVGGRGDDTFQATANDGDDIYYGDDIGGDGGSDTLDMSRITADITVDLGSGASGPGQASSAQSGTDVLWSIESFLGGAGDDVITAGRGVNQMDGGGGNDVYRFLSAEDADGDVISGFEPGDRIDLSQIDANGSGAGNGTFSLVSGDFTGQGQLLVTHGTDADGDVTVIQGNVDGDSTPDFSITVRGRHNLVDEDFQL